MKLYREETERALENFSFSYHTTHKELIYAIVEIKKAAAYANVIDKGIASDIGERVEAACEGILAGKYDDQFVTCALQGGAGTSINMNVNEVIASLASCHPLDHVNKSQSTNDVNPSALKIVSYRKLMQLIHTLETSVFMFTKKATEWAHIPKLARTHLQDAVSTTVGAEFAAYAAIPARHQQTLEKILPLLLELNLGGTAIGNRVNASETYVTEVYSALEKITHISVKPLPNLMSGTSSQTDFVLLSKTIVTLFVDLSKIASDIRLMVSGPGGGLGELFLPKSQNGSTIMPGKINPVIAESVNQTYFLLSGLSVTIEMAAQASQLELGVMFPILADSLITTLLLSSEALAMFTEKCITVLSVREEKTREHLERSTAYATMLTPILGYDIVSSVVEQAIAEKKTIIAVLEEKQLMNTEIKKALEG